MSSEPVPSGLSRAQIDAITLVERVSSGFSLAGLTFIIVSFICIPAIRKPIHRLMFYAAWGDIFYNIATLIATAGIDAGQSSPLCQFQGFTIEMYVPESTLSPPPEPGLTLGRFLWTDTLWNLAMAVDVYLTVFRRYDNRKLRELEKWYIISIYGFSFSLAFVLCFAKDSERGSIYGPAVLWCWISLEWDFMRIVMLYAPVWFVGPCRRTRVFADVHSGS
jgi:G protein-coupled glucose receptor regulating Gpa2